MYQNIDDFLSLLKIEILLHGYLKIKTKKFVKLIIPNMYKTNFDGKKLFTYCSL